MIARLGTLLIATLIITLAGTRLTAAPAQQLTPVADGAHIHPRYETEIAALWQANSAKSTENAMLRGTVSALSQSTQPATHTPTATPTATRTATATSTPSATGTPTATNTPQGTANAPTEEVLATMSRTPTFAPGTFTYTPTRPPVTIGTVTPAPTIAGDCEIWADFVANTGIKRRAAPSLSGTILTPSITTGRIEVVCYETLTQVDDDGLRWIRVSADRVEWFAVGQQEGDTFEWWGTITLWR